MIDVVSVNPQEHEGQDRHVLRTLGSVEDSANESPPRDVIGYRRTYSLQWDSLLGRCEEASGVWEGENYIV